ncbi:MAG: FixH family protein [Phycisphaerales bacterium]
MSEAAPVRSRLWPGMIFALLGLNVVAVGVTVFFAQKYKATVVDRSYDVTAQHWDQVKAQQEHQAALGWTCSLAVDESQAQRTLRIAISDSHRQPVPGASVEVVCFHNAHASDPLTLMAAYAGGEYTAPVPAMQDGLWTFRVRATTPSEEAQFTIEREAASLRQGARGAT